MKRLTLSLIFSSLILAGCGILNEDSSIDSQITFGLELSTYGVESGGSFVATYFVHNGGKKTVDFESNCSSLVFPVIYQGDAIVNFYGTGLGCRSFPQTFQLNPGESLHFNWDIHAYSISKEPGEDAVKTPIDSGSYSLKIEPHLVNVKGHEWSIPVVEKAFTVF